MKKPIREGLAYASTTSELQGIALMIQNQVSDIPAGEKKVLEILFYAQSQWIKIDKKIYNETMKVLGSKARIFWEESSGNLGKIE